MRARRAYHMQFVNDQRGSRRRSNVAIHPDLNVSVVAARGLQVPTPHLSLIQMAEVELLTSYGRRFWAGPQFAGTTAAGAA